MSTSIQLPKIKLTRATASPPQVYSGLAAPTKVSSSLMAQLGICGDWKPYREQVIAQLSKTQLKAELIGELEEKLFAKSQTELEKLRCERNFDVAKKYYLSTCRHIIANLKSDNSIGNLRFIEIVNSEKIPLDEVVNLTPQEMHEERWKYYIEKKENDMTQQLKKPEATTDMFFCGRCKKAQCTYYESQDRCADEPMTVHITCCNCGNKWRQ